MKGRRHHKMLFESPEVWEEQAQEAIHAEAIDRCPQRRKQVKIRSLLNLLDELNREGRRTK